MVQLTARGGRGLFGVDDRRRANKGPRLGCAMKFGPNVEGPREPPKALRLGPCFVQSPLRIEASAEADTRRPY